MALFTATQEANYLRTLLKDLKYEQTVSTKIYQDNKGSIKIAENPIANKQTNKTHRYQISLYKEKELNQRKSYRIRIFAYTKYVSGYIDESSWNKHIYERFIPFIFGTSRLRG